ncbi:MAG: hypothetical protein PVS3B2_00240 [Candidatus Dormibacteraceae bacterium]
MTTVRTPDGQSVYHVSEHRFWSPVLGEDAVRLSMFDDHGGEFYMVVPERGGREYRQTRLDAVEAIDQAIREGLQPGEVKVLQ